MLATRIASAAVLIAVLALCLAIGSAALALLAAAVAALAVWEFRDLCQKLRLDLPLWFVVPLAVWTATHAVLPTVLPSASGDLQLILGAAIVVGLGATLLTSLTWPAWCAAFAGSLYIGIGLSSWFQIANHSAAASPRAGTWEFLAVVVMVIACDTGAYAVGSLWGKRPFFPTISPKKSVEGAIGGVVATVIGALIVNKAWLGIGVAEAILLALVVAVVAQAGDLVESSLKRQAHTKDSSDLIPGHGGLLDRLDSALLVGPVALAFLHLVGAV